MAWSYDPTDLDTTTASGRLNTVRLLIGDTEYRRSASTERRGHVCSI
jgi:hypothetical protein